MLLVIEESTKSIISLTPRMVGFKLRCSGELHLEHAAIWFLEKCVKGIKLVQMFSVASNYITLPLCFITALPLLINLTDTLFQYVVNINN